MEGRTLSMKEAQSIADQNLPKGEGWRWNQAMIEIGATICTAEERNVTNARLRNLYVDEKSTATDPAISKEEKLRPSKAPTGKVEVS